MWRSEVIVFMHWPINSLGYHKAGSGYGMCGIYVCVLKRCWSKFRTDVFRFPFMSL